MRVTRADKTINSILPRVISTDFPDEKYEDLLKKLDLSDKDGLTFSQHKKVFINAIYLFLKGKWSQDELSTLANDFWTSKEEKWDEFGDALYACAELTFYIRNIYHSNAEEDRGNFDEFMIEMMKFYEKHFADVVPDESDEAESQDALQRIEKFGFDPK